MSASAKAVAILGLLAVAAGLTGCARCYVHGGPDFNKCQVSVPI
jgi:hypothetical protein